MIRHLLAVFLACVLTVACGGKDDGAADDASASDSATSDTATPDGASERADAPQADPTPARLTYKPLDPSIDIAADNPAYTDLPKVRIETSLGPITVALFPEQAPGTVENFLNYVEGRHYHRTVFHRIIPGFMIQGGGFSTFYEQRATDAPIAYEGDNGLSNERGTIAMARTSDPDSATAQWYINHEDNPSLDHGARGAGVPGYTVFGRVMAGMNVVDAIAAVPTGPLDIPAGRTLPNAPLQPVVISRVAVIVEETGTDEASE